MIDQKDIEESTFKAFRECAVMLRFMLYRALLTLSDDAVYLGLALSRNAVDRGIRENYKKVKGNTLIEWQKYIPFDVKAGRPNEWASKSAADLLVQYWEDLNIETSEEFWITLLYHYPMDELPLDNEELNTVITQLNSGNAEYFRSFTNALPAN